MSVWSQMWRIFRIRIFCMRIQKSSLLHLELSLTPSIMTILIIFFCILNKIWIILTVHTFSPLICESTISFLSIVILNQISLVGNQSDDDTIIWKLADLVQPLSQIDKGLNVGNIVHKESSNCKSVMSCCDLYELLCSRSVPDLCFNSLFTIWQRDVFEFKFNTVSGLGFWIVITFGDSK